MWSNFWIKGLAKRCASTAEPRMRLAMQVPDDNVVGIGTACMWVCRAQSHLPRESFRNEPCKNVRPYDLWLIVRPQHQRFAAPSALCWHPHPFLWNENYTTKHVILLKHLNHRRWFAITNTQNVFLSRQQNGIEWNRPGGECEEIAWV